MRLNLVLHEPEIPQNTGNIARTCAVTGASLHLIRPLGFSTDDRTLRRAGLDYWDKLDIHYYDSMEEFLTLHKDCEIFYFSTKAKRTYAECDYPQECYLVFGKESKGLPEPLLQTNLDRCLRIPMRSTLRSLNLSNAVAIAAYEALRQHGFEGLEGESGYFNTGDRG